MDGRFLLTRAIGRIGSSRPKRRSETLSVAEVFPHRGGHLGSVASHFALEGQGEVGFRIIGTDHTIRLQAVGMNWSGPRPDFRRDGWTS